MIDLHVPASRVENIFVVVPYTAVPYVPVVGDSQNVGAYVTLMFVLPTSSDDPVIVRV
jgi:hypothetical protein